MSGPFIADIDIVYQLDTPQVVTRSLIEIDKRKDQLKLYFSSICDSLIDSCIITLSAKTVYKTKVLRNLSNRKLIEKYLLDFTLNEAVAVCCYLTEKQSCEWNGREQRITRARIALHCDVSSINILENAKNIYKQFVFVSAQILPDQLITRNKNTIHQIRNHSFDIFEEDDTIDKNYDHQFNHVLDCVFGSDLKNNVIDR